MDILEQLLAQAEADDNVLLERVISQYLAMVKRLQGRLDAFEVWLEGQDTLTTAEVLNSPLYKALQEEYEAEMQDYSSWLATELRAEVTRSGEAGLIAGITLLAAVTGESTSALTQVGFNALDALNVYLANDGALMQRIRGAAGFGVDTIKQIIINGVGLGRNSAKIANEILERGFGVGLTDALRWTRTLQNYSYRWANLASYEANGITSWIWWAKLDDRTCASCISLHGQIFPISDGVANDHHNGRCAMLPYVEGMTVNVNAGREWFDSQSEAVQKDILGVGKWEAYKAGKFTFDKLSTTYNDGVFGIMRREATLKELTE